MGRIGMAISPADPNVVYAIVEARYGKNGFYKSTNKEKIGVNKVAILQWKLLSGNILRSEECRQSFLNEYIPSSY